MHIEELEILAELQRAYEEFLHDECSDPFTTKSRYVRTLIARMAEKHKELEIENLMDGKIVLEMNVILTKEGKFNSALRSHPNIAYIWENKFSVVKGILTYELTDKMIEEQNKNKNEN